MTKTPGVNSPTFPDPSQDRSIMRAWDRFVGGAPLPSNRLRSVIERSWQRCLSLAVDPGRTQAPAVLPAEELEVVRRRHRELVEASRRIMAEAHDLLSESGTIMMLTDPTGVVLQTEGDPGALESGFDIRLVTGATWDEVHCGTNAIGTALSLGRAVQVHAGEHFCLGPKAWTCSATVVRDPANGQVLGALDVSGLQRTFDRHCLALAQETAARIEDRLAAREMELRERLLEAGLGRLSRAAAGGLAFFDRRGCLIKADARAGESLAAMGVSLERAGEIRIDADGPDGAPHLPDWLRAELVERVVEGDEPLGTIVLLPAPLRSESSASRGAVPAVASARLRAEPADHFGAIIGGSALLRQAVHRARMLANLDTAVLLQGETGVGKELFARAIHESGPRKHGPFVAVNCGGLPRDTVASELFGYVEGAFTGARRSGMIGKIEAANGGTLFLDEMGEMPLDVQPYFLRVLEGGEVQPLGTHRPRPVEFRLVAASNRDLLAGVGGGRFRSDLFYRISATAVRIPSLRERPEDISTLVDRFCRDVARRHGVPVKRFDGDVLRAFEAYPWPGNVRELRNVVEGLALLTEGDVVGITDLPPNIASTVKRNVESAASETGLEGVERDAIASAIRKHGGNLTHVATRLGISKSTLYLKVKKYSLESVLREVRPATR
jgi:sigma-54 dependent transcriptional regulator, acetoin dehydrogenase operon transcriptional activator AcoR